MLRDQPCAFIVHGFGHYGETGFFARTNEQLESLDAESLKGVRRAARLECTAAQRGAASLAHKLRGANDLRLRFDRAGTCDYRDVGSTEGNTGCDRDDRRLGPPFARHLLVRLRDVDDSHDARQGLDPTGIDPSVVADESNGRALRARHRMRRISHLVYDRNYALHVCRGRAVTHYYKHDALDLRYGAEPCAARCRSVNQTPAVAGSDFVAGTDPAIASSTAGPRKRTLTMDDTPGSCMVTPYTASADSVVVRGLCVITMNCVFALNSFSILTNRPMFASSSGASTSSMRQNGLGFIRNIPNRRDRATSARSPLESR